GRDRPPAGQGRVRVAGRAGRDRGGQDARGGHPEAAGHRRGDRLAQGARAARRREARSGSDRPHAGQRPEVRRGPGRGPRRRPGEPGVRLETVELDLAPVVAAFGRRLHEAGVPVTAERSARLASALTLTRPVSRTRLYWTARAVMVSDHAQIAAFD